MATEIVMPRLSDSMEEGTVLRWFVSQGDSVAEGEPLVEVGTDMASLTYESEVSGTVLAIGAQPGQSVAVGAVLAVVGQPGDPASPRDVRGAGTKGDTTGQSLTRVQQTIARRAAQSRATVPDFELRAQIDMSELVALREQLRSAEAFGDELPTYNDFIVKAAALALREHPRVNGSYRDGQLELHSRINIGIAVAAEDALVTPTIFDADLQTVSQIATASRNLATKVRNGAITPAELRGATFSVTNLGMYGVDSFSAVVNAPQAAVLAVGSLCLRPLATPEGEIVARHTVNVSLACDHRILYGADGARFLARLREILEQPRAELSSR